MIRITENLKIGINSPTILFDHKEKEKIKDEVQNALEESKFKEDSNFMILLNLSYFNDGKLKIQITNATENQKIEIKKMLEKNLKRKFIITQ